MNRNAIDSIPVRLIRCSTSGPVYGKIWSALGEQLNNKNQYLNGSQMQMKLSSPINHQSEQSYCVLVLPITVTWDQPGYGPESGWLRLKRTSNCWKNSLMNGNGPKRNSSFGRKIYYFAGYYYLVILNNGKAIIDDEKRWNISMLVCVCLYVGLPLLTTITTEFVTITRKVIYPNRFFPFPSRYIMYM